MTTRAAVGQACVFLLKTPPTPFASAVDAIKRDAESWEHDAVPSG